MAKRRSLRKSNLRARQRQDREVWYSPPELDGFTLAPVMLFRLRGRRIIRHTPWHGIIPYDMLRVVDVLVGEREVSPLELDTTAKPGRRARGLTSRIFSRQADV